MTLTTADWRGAAERLGCPPAVIRAVGAVESNGQGFNPDGSCVTLFEGHKFSRFTHRVFDQSHPDLSYPVWNRTWYGKTWQAEQDRLHRAMALDRSAALMSASWGLFQLMGFNFALCGFGSVERFVTAMQTSEAEQLSAFVTYLLDAGLDRPLRHQDWFDFARRYNGASFYLNRYAQKLARAYEQALIKGG